LDHTVTAKYNKTLRARDVKYHGHPLEFLGYKTCAVLQVKPQEEFMLRLEYNDPLEKHHCIKLLNGNKLQNTY
jgi:hypothetical protein